MKVYLILKVSKRLTVFLEKKDLPVYGKVFAWGIALLPWALMASAASLLWRLI